METKPTTDGAVFGQAGGELPAEKPRTPEEQAAWDAEDARLCKKHGCNPGWGHHYEEALKRQAPPVGSTIDPGPK